MEFITKQFAFQKEDFDKHKDDAYLALFIDMGGGKTKMTIDFIRYKNHKHNQIFKTLVIAPNIALVNWKREFYKHSELGDYVEILQGTAKKRRQKLNDPTKKIFIINYEGLKVLHEELLDAEFVIVVCDEVQKIKVQKNTRSKIAIQLGAKAKCRYILSGTPILNSPLDIFSEYLFLDGGKTFGTNFWAFKNRYFEDRYVLETNKLKHEMAKAYEAGDTKTASGLKVRIRKREEGQFPIWEPKPGIIEILHNKIRKIASVRKKIDCLPYLPPKVFQQFDVELTKEQRKAYNDLEKYYITFMDKDPVTASNALTRDLRFCQIVSGFLRNEKGDDILFSVNPKLDALKELLEELAPEHKVIIWAVFRSNIEMLVNELQEYNPVYIYGGIKDKQTPQDVFNNDPKCRVFIGNPTSCGIAINLIAADYTIRYSYNYSLEDWLQSAERNHRAGSEVHEKITYIDLAAINTLDNKIIASIKNKENIADSVISGFKQKEVNNEEFN